LKQNQKKKSKGPYMSAKIGYCHLWPIEENLGFNNYFGVYLVSLSLSNLVVISITNSMH